MYLGAMGVDVASLVKRFGIVRADNGGVESGACYPGCSAADIGACKPMSFPSQAAFNQYAQANGEWPQILGTAIPDSAQWNDLRQQAFRTCAPAPAAPAPAAVTAAPAPVVVAPPVVLLAPASDGGGTQQVTVSRPLRSQFQPPTGVATPTIIMTPSGPTYVPPTPQQETTGSSTTDYLPWVIGGGLVLLLLTRR
jgi:hypothetical protein